MWLHRVKINVGVVAILLFQRNRIFEAKKCDRDQKKWGVEKRQKSIFNPVQPHLPMAFLCTGSVKFDVFFEQNLRAKKFCLLKF